jgi:hypothetical protein
MFEVFIRETKDGFEFGMKKNGRKLPYKEAIEEVEFVVEDFLNAIINSGFTPNIKLLEDKKVSGR